MLRFRIQKGTPAIPQTPLMESLFDILGFLKRFHEHYVAIQSFFDEQCPFGMAIPF